MSYESEFAAWGRHADASIASRDAEITRLAGVLQASSTELGRVQGELAAAQLTVTDLRRQLAECGGTGPAGFGVNIHTNYRQSQYANDAAVLDAVQRLGATRGRTFLVPSPFWDQVGVFRAYRDAGIKVHVTVGNYARSKDTDKPKLIAALLDVVDCVDSVAGFNEPDSGGVARSTWLPKAAAWHNWLWAAVKGHPELKHLLVLPGALQGKDDSPDDTAAYAAALDGFDRWNAHWYPGNVPDVQKAYEARKATWPAPTWITEFGGNITNIDQATATRNLTEILRLHNGAGETAFIYELLGADEFGMFNQNWQPTPSGAAVIQAVS